MISSYVTTIYKGVEVRRPSGYGRILPFFTASLTNVRVENTPPRRKEASTVPILTPDELSPEKPGCRSSERFALI